MKYTVAILALAAGVFAIPQDASSITSAPAATSTPELLPAISCVNNCEPGDVTCQAACLGAAHPNTANVIDTTKCAEKCDQGDGSKEDSDKFSACVQSCISNHFPTSQTVAPAAGASAGASGASNAANPTGSAGSSASGTGSNAAASESGSGSSAPASTAGANANSVHIVGAGFAGLMAFFAL
jgi:hypothetical protein